MYKQYNVFIIICLLQGCLSLTDWSRSAMSCCLCVTHGCVSLFRMDQSAMRCCVCVSLMDVWVHFEWTKFAMIYVRTFSWCFRSVVIVDVRVRLDAIICMLCCFAVTLCAHGCEGPPWVDVCHDVLSSCVSLMDVWVRFEWTKSAMRCCVSLMDVWVRICMRCCVCVTHGCVSPFRMDRICHEVLCVCHSWMCESVSNGPYLPWGVVCVSLMDVWVRFEWTKSAMRCCLCVTHGCVSPFRMDQICHEMLCVCHSWMCESILNGPYLPWGVVCVSLMDVWVRFEWTKSAMRCCVCVTHGCVSPFRMDRICHEVLFVCHSWMCESVSNGPNLPWDVVCVSLMDVWVRFEWTVSAMRCCVCVSLMDVWVRFEWTVSAMSCVCVTHGCVSPFRIDQICHEVLFVCHSWMCESVSNEPNLPWDVVCVSLRDVWVRFEWTVSAMRCCVCVSLMDVWVHFEWTVSAMRCCVCVTHGCVSPFWMDHICHEVLFVCHSWMCESVSNGPYLPWVVVFVCHSWMCESILNGLYLPWGVVCVSLMDVWVRFEWTKSAMRCCVSLMDVWVRICHEVLCVCHSWMCESVLNGPNLPWDVVCVSLMDVWVRFEWTVSAMRCCVCVSLMDVWVRFEWTVSAMRCCVCVTHGCVSPLRMDQICHELLCVCYSWMCESVSNGPNLPWDVVCVSLMDVWVHFEWNVSAMSCCVCVSLMDVWVRFEWTVSAMSCCVCVTHGCVSPFWMDCICHEVLCVCHSWMCESISNGPNLPWGVVCVSLMDVWVRFEWTKSAMRCCVCVTHGCVSPFWMECICHELLCLCVTHGCVSPFRMDQICHELCVCHSWMCESVSNGPNLPWDVVCVSLMDVWVRFKWTVSAMRCCVCVSLVDVWVRFKWTVSAMRCCLCVTHGCVSPFRMDQICHELLFVCVCVCVCVCMCVCLYVYMCHWYLNTRHFAVCIVI